MPPYWERARAWAKAETKTFSLVKALPSVMIAILQYLFTGRSTGTQMLVSIALAIGTYMVLLSCEYAWKLLVLGPVAIDAQRATEAEGLRQKIKALTPTISPLEQNRRGLVAKKLAEIDEPFRDVAKTVLRLLIEHGATYLK